MMSQAPEPLDNPFPPKAVTTFGASTGRAAKFEYMNKALRQVVEYLQTRNGGALALSGGHGTGKTFLLDWLANQAKAFRSVKVQVIYAKADNQNLTDVYRQLIRSLTREDMIRATRSAIVNIGSSIVGTAKATEGIARNLADAAKATAQHDSPESVSSRTLQSAVDAKILDTNELYLRLKGELKKIGVSPAISEQIGYAVGVLEHAEFGQAAFDWLAGGTPQLPKDMPLQDSLWRIDSADAGDIATTALECLAGLYRLAGLPLIVVLDQMENFIPVTTAAAQQASLVKKLVEQLSDQSALLIMAGTPAAWAPLPRDVWPRLLNRGPVAIGGLNKDETALLLHAYFDREPGFTSEAVEEIRDLSGGGNAREILRIAYRIFEKTGGAVAEVTSENLIQAAEDTGSLADRAVLALQVIDAVAERMKFPARTAATKQGKKIDRWITGPNGANLAVVLLTSPDPRSEAEDARKLTELRKEIASEPGAPGVFAVAIGYSSERVRNLIGEISDVVLFEEGRFSSDVEQALEKLAITTLAPSRPESQELSELLSHLTKLDDRLARIETSRVEAEQRTAEALVKGTEELAEPERARIETRTRTELRFGLNELHDALANGSLSDERQILQRLLVANEADVRSQPFDYLGNIYLDALDSVRFLDISGNYELMRQFSALRSDIIRSMRTALSPPASAALLSRLAAAAAFVVAAVPVTFLVWGNIWRFAKIEDPSAFLWALLAGAFAGAIAWYLALVVFQFLAAPQRHFSFFISELDDLRKQTRQPSPPAPMPYDGESDHALKSPASPSRQ
jgi:hypothetical protein